jgi:hypothetical protein
MTKHRIHHCLLSWLYLVMSVFFAPTLAQAAEEAVPFVAPMEFDLLGVGCPVVKLSVNGSRPLSFVIDTGSAIPLTIMRWASDELKLTRPGELLLDPYVPVGKCVVLGNRGTFPLPVKKAGIRDESVFDNYGTEPHAGTIGVETLLGLRVVMDFDAQEITLSRPNGTPTARLEGIVFDLHKKQHKSLYQPKYFVSVRLPVRIGTEKREVELNVDTGSDATLLPKDLIALWEPYTIGTDNMPFTEYNAPGHKVTRTRKRYLFHSLEFGGMIVPLLAPVDSTDSLVPAVLGIDVLARYRVTLDFPNGKLSLVPRPSQEKTPLLVAKSEVGLAYKKGEPDYYLYEYPPDSLIEKAGAKGIQRILSVDGKPLSGVLWQSAKLRVQGYVGTTATLELEREDDSGNKTRHTISYVRRPAFVFRAVVLPRQGLFVQYTLEALEVTSVEAGSNSEQAGIKAGDVILSVNGKPTSKLTPPQLERETYKPEGTVTVFVVQRKGEKEPRTLSVKAKK